MDETQNDSEQSFTNGCAFRRSRRKHLRPKLKLQPSLSGKEKGIITAYQFSLDCNSTTDDHCEAAPRSSDRCHVGKNLFAKVYNVCT